MPSDAAHVNAGPFSPSADIQVLQELALAASEPVPISDTFQLVMESIGRHFEWFAGRIVPIGDSSINGETEFHWTNSRAVIPHWGTAVSSPLPPPVIGIDELTIIDLAHPPMKGIEPYQAGTNIRGYIICPIRVDNEKIATLEFWSGEPIGDEPNLRAILAHGASLLGLVLERNQVQGLLRERERRFKGIFNQSYQFISLLKPDGTLIEVNETALQFGGVEAEAEIGKKIWESSWWKNLPQSQVQLRSAVEQAASGEFVRFEVSFHGAAEREVIVDLSIKPVRNRNGEIVLLITEGRDITELRQALEHLRLADQRLEEAQRIANIGHWEYSVLDDRAVYSDTLWEIFGIDANTTTHSVDVLLSRIHPDDLNGLQRLINRSFQSGKAFDTHVRLLRPDGLTRMVYIAGQTIYDHEGRPLRLAGIVQDVSRRRKLEDSLANSVNRLSGLNEMGQAVASTHDLKSIYDYVLSAGRKLLNADAMILFLSNDDELVITAIDQIGEIDLLGHRLPSSAGIAGEAWVSGEPVWLSGEECRQRRSPFLVNSSGYHPNSIIAVPVRWQDQILGVLEATDLDEDAFDSDDVSMLQAIANWTAIAIGKASQHESLQRRLKESEAIAEVSRALSGTLEPQAILKMIVDIAHDIVPSSDWAVIHLLRGRPEQLDPIAVAGTDADLSGYIIQRDEGIAGLAIREGRLINTGDTQSDPRSSSYAQMVGLRSLLVAPIQTRSRSLGTISLHCMQINAFTEEDERLLTILAAQAGLAIENAYLFDSQRRARLVAELQRERLRVLTDRIVTAQEEERLRISRELHDEAGQALTSLKISLDLIRSGLPPGLDALRERLQDLASLTGETMETLRTLAHDLRPPGLDAFGLNVAMEGLCHDYSTRTGLHVDYHGVEIPELPTTVALSMYRFAQEALTNIAKHAEARNVEVNLFRAEGMIQLSISDDGKGFDYDPEAGQSGGIGLVSMQERIDLIGGVLEIITRAGSGTKLIARVPEEPHARVALDD